MSSFASVFRLTLTFTLCTGCSPGGGSEGPTEDLLVAVSQPLYPVSWRGERWAIDIDFSLTNASESSVYLPGCPEARLPELEKWVGGEWVSAYVPAARSCGAPPSAVAPQETRVDTLRIRADVPRGTVLSFLDPVTIDGFYRLVWRARDDEPASTVQRGTSGSFRISKRRLVEDPASGASAWR